ncbi:hypothetical protein [Streptomyces cucumeris]|uniref:hypothetical protein n=1 Tax=Streptomyces cucumeris TaxID=2962890 RepID=UPI0020C911ED|nr:hypothetical protein [Streptomyces sp. NEAU-Y11]MCP9209713.1 hypothetical protein [Streptomyces sp. NEAU-Y11]
MPELHIIRHILRPHEPHKSEEYDPGGDMLIVVHKNPNDPDDPVEFGHHIRLQGLSYRKEMWGAPDYASTLDMELRDLERYYARHEAVDYGPHPLADITEHYFEGPPVRMRSFAPGYVMDRMGQAVMPGTTDGVMRFCVDTVLSGIEDVKSCLASDVKQSFPCRGMTGLSTDSVATRSDVMDRMAEQGQQMDLISSRPLDDVRQLLTDREAELETVRDNFVNHALMESQVPEIMRKRVVGTAIRRGLLTEEGVANG